MPFGHGEREPVGRVGPHQDEVAGRVPVPEVAPSPQEAVHIPHDLLGRDQQRPAIRQLTDPIVGVCIPWRDRGVLHPLA